MKVQTLMALLLGALTAACGAEATLSNGGPPPPGGSVGGPTGVEVPPGQLNLVTVALTAPSLAQKVVSFYAVRGQTREGVVWYHAKPGRPDSTKLVRLKVPKGALATRPDGSTIAPGDSLLITMTVTDTTSGIVDMQPSGLVFASGSPATLTIWYLEADHDFNHDNVIDSTDARIKASLSVWMQELSTDPWQQLRSVNDTTGEEAETDITGFTRYAVAF
jgi:hypothetical protein